MDNKTKLTDLPPDVVKQLEKEVHKAFGDYLNGKPLPKKIVINSK